MARTAKKPVSIGLEHELDLPDIIVTDKQEKGSDILYTVYAKKRPVCWRCDNPHLTVHSSHSTCVSDLPRFGKRIGLRIVVRRYFCPNCKTVTPDDSLFFYKGKMTCRLRNAIGISALHQSFSAVSRQYGCSESTVTNLFWGVVQLQASEYAPVMPETMAIDRIRIQNSKARYTVLIDLDREPARIIELGTGQNEASVKECLAVIREPERCRKIFTDMHEEFRNAVRDNLGNRIILIVDKRHVLQALDSAFDSIRIAISKKCLIKNRSRAFKANRLLLNTEYEKLNRKQSEDLKDLLEQYPEFRKVYDLKEAFINIFCTNDSGSARRSFLEWKNACKEEGVTEYNHFISLIDRWEEEIFAYFDFTGEDDRITAAEEALFKTAREGHRYKFDVLRAKVLYSPLVEQPGIGRMDFEKFK